MPVTARKLSEDLKKMLAAQSDAERVLCYLLDTGLVQLNREMQIEPGGTPEPPVEAERLYRKAEAAKAAIAEQRDRLRNLISDLQELEQNCDDAEDYLSRAVDELSRLV